MAEAVFHPAWIPESVDPTVDQLKKVRVIAGTIAALGVYTFVQGGFAFDQMLQNTLTACLVVLLITPLTVGVMLYVWRRGGTVRQLRPSLILSLKLLLLFIGSVVLTVVMWQLASSVGGPGLLLGFVALWLTGFVGSGALRVSGNFFGTAAVHRCLPPLLASVTTWLMAIPDLVTGDLHGLSLRLGIVFILGAPVTVTGIAVLEMHRLKRRYGIRLGAHPATLPRLVAVPPTPPPPVYPTNGYLPPQGNPYGHPYGHPHGTTPYGRPDGNLYAPGSQHPYGPPNPYNRRGPYSS